MSLLLVLPTVQCSGLCFLFVIIYSYLQECMHLFVYMTKLQYLVISSHIQSLSEYNHNTAAGHTCRSIYSSTLLCTSCDTTLSATSTQEQIGFYWSLLQSTLC